MNSKSRFRKSKSSPYDIPRPAKRKLRIFSIDPSLFHSTETAEIREALVEIPWEVLEKVSADQIYGIESNESSQGKSEEDGLRPGPCGEYVEVIDYDPTTSTFYKPVDLNDPYLLVQNGLAPSDGNPQFHQQMVYAVAMRTIRNFEVALGRLAFWSPHKISDDFGNVVAEEYVPRLRIYPHALREPNAYYSPRKKALLFGYFQATPDSSKKHIPGGMVFTCLSHDIIAHETAHALLDGMHQRLIEPSNVDVLAFHEAFADIVALFQHFSFPDVVRHQIAKTRGDLGGADNLLVNLAQEFGHATGRTGALRSAIGSPPDPAGFDSITEPHKRGAVLVAAVFDAFLNIYRRRTADLFRLATMGTGILPEGELHPDLVGRLSDAAAKTAQHVLTICIRALDYLPPVDITLGDYLRALITADFDLVAEDALQYRIAFMESFRRRGLYPRNVRTLSEESLRWEGPEINLDQNNINFYLGSTLKNVLQDWNLDADRKVIYEDLKFVREKTKEIIENSRSYKQERTLGLNLDYDFEVYSIRPVRRTGPEGQLLVDMVIEITQSTRGFFDHPRGQGPVEGEPDFWFRSGCTLIVDMKTGSLRYCIYKDINSDRRYKRQQEYMSGRYASPSLNATYFDADIRYEKEDIFSYVHRMLSMEEGQ